MEFSVNENRNEITAKYTEDEWRAICEGEGKNHLDIFPRLEVGDVSMEDTPSEDEVYRQALIRRADNLTQKMSRLSQEIRDSIKDVSQKAGELMSSKMECNRLVKELELPLDRIGREEYWANIEGLEQEGKHAELNEYTTINRIIDNYNDTNDVIEKLFTPYALIKTRLNRIFNFTKWGTK